MASINVYPEDSTIILVTELEDNTTTRTFNNGHGIKVVEGSTVTYYISREGYYPQQGTVVVDGNTRLEINLLKRTNVKQRVVLTTPQTTESTINIYNSDNVVISTGTGKAYADVEVGSFISYKITAEGYARSSGAFTVYSAANKEILLRSGEGEEVYVNVNVKPKGTYIRSNYTVTSTTVSGSTLTNPQINISSGTVTLWKSNPSLVRTQLVYSHVVVLNSDGTPHYIQVPIYAPGTTTIIGYEYVLEYRDVWVDENLGEFTTSEINSKFGITYNGTASLGDMLVAQAPAVPGDYVKAQVRFTYPEKIQLTENKTNALENFVIDSSKPAWQSLPQTEVTEYTFTRVSVLKRDPVTHEILYEIVPIELDNGQPSGETELRPVMIDAWTEASTGEVLDADLVSTFGITFTGTPVVGDSFIVAYLPAVDITKEVDEDGLAQVNTSGFVYPDVTYYVSLQDYNRWEDGATTITETIHTTTGESTRGVLKAEGTINKEIKLHCTRNLIVLDTRGINNISVPGVYNIDPYYFPESYPSKYFHYELVGAGGGGVAVGRQLYHRKHGGLFHRRRSHYHYYGSAASGASGAYTTGYLGGNLEQLNTPSKITVNVGYPGKGATTDATKVSQGSSTFLEIDERKIEAGGGGNGFPSKVIGLNDFYLFNWTWTHHLYRYRYIAGTDVVDGAIKATGGIVKIWNTAKPSTLCDGVDGTLECQRDTTVYLDEVPSPYPDRSYHVGYGGAASAVARNSSANVGYNGGPGFARIVVNDSPDISDLTTIHA